MNTCPFCTSREVQERIIVSTDAAFAFPGSMPIVPGHTLACPKRCVATMEELTQEECVAVFEMVAMVKQALKKTVCAEGFNVAWNEGAIAGQSVPHLHVHVVPRKNGDAGIYKYEPRQFLYRPGARAEMPEAELQELARDMRNTL